MMALLRSTLAAAPMALAVRWLFPHHAVPAIAGGVVFYLPLYLAIGGLGPGGSPALRRWLRERRARGGGKP